MMKICLFILCFIVPLSSYADNAQILENKSDNQDVEMRITKTLKHVIDETLSNHEEPVGCAYVLGDTTCKGHDSFYYRQNGINTPLDVYCAEKADCCSGANKQRNREQYCDCRANKIREKSYDWENINDNDIWGLKLKNHFVSDDSCSEYSDVFIEADQIYDRLFYECKRKNSDVKFCDKLAQTIHNLISTELKKQAVNKAKKNSNDMLQVSLIASVTPCQLYESEYKKIVNSKEFLSLFEQ